MKLKLLFIASLVLLGLLTAAAAFHPFTSVVKYSTVQRSQLLKMGDDWVIQMSLINKEDADASYTIHVKVDGTDYPEQPVLLPSERTYSYIHHIARKDVREGIVNIRVFRNGIETPVYEMNYFLRETR